MKPGLKNNGENEGGLAHQMLSYLSLQLISQLFEKKSNALHWSVITSSIFLYSAISHCQKESTYRCHWEPLQYIAWNKVDMWQLKYV